MAYFSVAADFLTEFVTVVDHIAQKCMVSHLTQVVHKCMCICMLLEVTSML